MSVPGNPNVGAPRFHALRIASVTREAEDAVVLEFAVPEALCEAFRHMPGQFLTLRTTLGGEELRRSYSICAGLDEGALRVAIKAVEGGRFSGWANSALKAGDTLEAMPPDGRFCVAPDPARARHVVAFAAGSGITPVLSIVRSVLAQEPRSRVTLVYGNRHVSSIMFCEALEDLKDRHLGRFTLHHVLSRDHQEVALFNGRIDRDKCAQFLAKLVPVQGIDLALVCGPAGMIEDVSAALAGAGLPGDRLLVERFVSADGAQAGPTRAGRAQVASSPAAGEAGAEVTVIVDGQSRVVRVPAQGPSILEVALQAGADLPYACKSGVCSTCRARLVSGEVEMARNFALDAGEVERGFILTCQSHPRSERVTVDYDQR